ncbi:MAG: type IX secretion system outer membrane channel protein PorV [Marinilabiliaceae bacterium]|nr:type IX secretion system outer membrane channel protein PorV [Marinilabiliaceae bacterium]
MIKKFFKKVIILSTFSFLLQTTISAQVEYGTIVNIIPTAVPFISIVPDSRAGGMGGAGVATPPDIYSQFWNPAKYAFIEPKIGLGIAFTPWLRHLIGDINLYNLTGVYRLDEMQVLSASIRYFSIGEIHFRQSYDDQGYTVSPNEFCIDLAYNRKLSDVFSGSVAFRYIRSDLQAGVYADGFQPGNSFAADLAFYFQKPMQLLGQNSTLSAGINISNIGSKITYNGTDYEFIPTNLRLGTALFTEIDAHNTITFTVDLNKLLVPTPGVPDDNETAQEYRDKYNSMGTLKGMFQSFSDAPGGFKEEMQEIMASIGAEYWYEKQFAIRAGYFHEHINKGNRKHFTAGLGLKFNMLTIDASYIIAVNQSNPLANTIRVSIGIDF